MGFWLAGAGTGLRGRAGRPIRPCGTARNSGSRHADRVSANAWPGVIGSPYLSMEPPLENSLYAAAPGRGAAISGRHRVLSARRWTGDVEPDPRRSRQGLCGVGRSEPGRTGLWRPVAVNNAIPGERSPRRATVQSLWAAAGLGGASRTALSLGSGVLESKHVQILVLSFLAVWRGPVPVLIRSRLAGAPTCVTFRRFHRRSSRPVGGRVGPEAG